MRPIPRHATALLIIFFISITSASAFGSFVFDVKEIGSAVIVTGNGSLNISGLTFSRSGASSGADIDGSLGGLAAGQVSSLSTVTYSQYTGILGSAQFGTGGYFNASFGSGDSVGVGLGTNLVVPLGYVSSSPLTDSSTFSSKTFASLGLTPGSYLYTWGSGPTADSLTINIGTGVPEPLSFAAMTVPAILALRRRPRRVG